MFIFLFIFCCCWYFSFWSCLWFNDFCFTFFFDSTVSYRVNERFKRKRFLCYKLFKFFQIIYQAINLVIYFILCRWYIVLIRRDGLFLSHHSIISCSASYLHDGTWHSFFSFGAVHKFRRFDFIWWHDVFSSHHFSESKTSNTSLVIYFQTKLKVGSILWSAWVFFVFLKVRRPDNLWETVYERQI